MKDWEEIRAWRRSVRADLLARRAAMLSEERKGAGSLLVDLLCERFWELRQGCIGFYWPFKGEPDLRRLIEDLLALGVEAALPVALERRQPLEFRAWRPGMKLERGEWNIPIPAERNIVRPTVLIVPLLGFDAAGYRLGYGGGHYDRTLAAMVPRPITIGVGYALGRLETIYPQPHDIPLDAIVTETGYVRHRNGGRLLGELNFDDATSLIGRDPSRCADGKREGGSLPESRERDLYEESDEAGASYASPPCFMHELDPSYLGYAGTAETIAMLNDLLGSALERDRCIAKAKADPTGGAEDGAPLHAMLRHHVLRLGGRPAQLLPETAEDRCDRAPGAIVRKLREILPKIGDGALHDDLKAALQALERQTRDRGESR